VKRKGKKEKGCEEIVGKGKLCEMLAFVSVIGRVCAALQGIRIYLTRDRVIWFNGNGEYLRGYR